MRKNKMTKISVEKSNHKNFLFEKGEIYIVVGDSLILLTKDKRCGETTIEGVLLYISIDYIGATRAVGDKVTYDEGSVVDKFRGKIIIEQD
jgi:hypothetical protein